MLDEPTVGLNGPLADANEMAIAGISKGLLKVLSKIGIATIRSYRGAQIFEIVGIDQEVVDEHFTGTPSRLGGIGLGEIAREALDRHARAYPEAHGLAARRARRGGRSARPRARSSCPRAASTAGVATARRHMWDPETIASLQRATRTDDAEQALGVLRGVQPPRQRGELLPRAASRTAAVRRGRGRRSRSRRSSRRPRSSSASRPAR